MVQTSIPRVIGHQQRCERHGFERVAPVWDMGYSPWSGSRDAGRASGLPRNWLSVTKGSILNLSNPCRRERCATCTENRKRWRSSTGKPARPEYLCWPAVARRLVRIAGHADVRRALDYRRSVGCRSSRRAAAATWRRGEARPRGGCAARGGETRPGQGARTTPGSWSSVAVNPGTTVAWTIEQGWPGLENMALIPGTVASAGAEHRCLWLGVEGSLRVAGGG